MIILLVFVNFVYKDLIFPLIRKRVKELSLSKRRTSKDISPYLSLAYIYAFYLAKIV